MTGLGGRRGIKVKIADCTMRFHPIFCTQSWGEIEAESFRAFAEIIQPGAVVFDIGASIGPYTFIALAKTGPSGRVVAYEPHDYSRRHLIRHLKWNGAGAQTVVRDVCCGARDSSAEFYYVPDHVEGMSGLVPVEGFEKRVVKVVTLDDEVTSLGVKPDVVKIDVEGGEWDVLKGAEKILREIQPILFLSLHRAALAKRRETPEEVLEWLSQRGFGSEVIATDHEIHVLVKPSADPAISMRMAPEQTVRKR